MLAEIAELPEEIDAARARLSREHVEKTLSAWTGTEEDFERARILDLNRAIATCRNLTYLVAEQNYFTVVAFMNKVEANPQRSKSGFRNCLPSRSAFEPTKQTAQ